jgi:chaperonin GroES
MKIRPLGDRAIVKRLESETKTAGGIVIPDSATEKPNKGKIIAIGKGKALKGGKHRPLDVKVGDVILFGKYSGTEFKEGKDEFVVLREEDIIGVLDDK